MTRYRKIVGVERQTLAKDLVKRYTDGESINALASSTGRSRSFVHRVLTEAGVQLRPRGGGRGRHWTSEELAQVAELADRGWSASRIGRKIGRAPQSVWDKLGQMRTRRVSG